MIAIIRADGTAERRQLDAMRARAAEKNADIELAVKDIMDHVRMEGFPAVERYSLQFDHSAPYELSKEQLDEAYSLCPPELAAALEHAARNIWDYNEKLLARSMEWTSPDGGRVGRIIRGMSRVGIYVPGGTAAYPSSVLMNAIPAKLAGCPEVVMVSPPTCGGDVNPVILAAAKIAGVDRVFRTGGAQGVAALAYGTGSVPRVDKIVGPGNAYVAEAKRQCYGQVGIDFFAGPSEVLAIADGSADPRILAADMLAQSEHDPMAKGIVVTTSRPVGEAVLGAVQEQLAGLETADIARASWETYGEVILADSLDEAVEIANRYAPEHLEVIVEDESILPRLVNFGSLFIGQETGEVFGDYASGTNHTLPTVRAARYTGGVWVGTFLKVCTFQRFQRGAMREIAPLVSRMARGEGLIAHARAAELRMELL